MNQYDCAYRLLVWRMYPQPLGSNNLQTASSQRDKSSGRGVVLCAGAYRFIVYPMYQCAGGTTAW